MEEIFQWPLFDIQGLCVLRTASWHFLNIRCIFIHRMRYAFEIDKYTVLDSDCEGVAKAGLTGYPWVGHIDGSQEKYVVTTIDMFRFPC